MADLILARQVLQEIAEKALQPPARREVARWARQVYPLSERRADPYVRNYRIRVLPRVMYGKALIEMKLLPFPYLRD